MRRLGDELGFEAMSLYRHVANKQDLLDGMLDLVLAEWQLPDAEDDWKEAIRTSASSVHDALRRHPWAARLLMTGSHLRPVRLRYMDGLLSRLHDAGFDAHDDLLRLPPARRLHLRFLALGDRVHLDPDGRRGRVEAAWRRSRGRTIHISPSIGTSTCTRDRTARRARSRSGST